MTKENSSKRKQKGSSSKKKNQVSIVEIHINMSFNNIIASITDLSGNVLAWSSGGKMGFKGSRKATPHSANLVIKNAMTTALDGYNFKSIKTIKVIGICPSRDSAIRSVMDFALTKNMPSIESIIDQTPIPHNGCRPPKKRRV
jgi:small subunit ribosomal protein S11